LIEFVSQDLTLRPDDIISTGTASSMGAISQPPISLTASDESFVA
jgi:2-keto-4-pentenoate hydratase/2-oxohepta-3-ene-1,7-dioic acid hydratase in catechol pathway